MELGSVGEDAFYKQERDDIGFCGSYCKHEVLQCPERIQLYQSSKPKCQMLFEIMHINIKLYRLEWCEFCKRNKKKDRSDDFLKQEMTLRESARRDESPVNAMRTEESNSRSNRLISGQLAMVCPT